MGVSDRIFESPKERWETLGPAYHRSLLVKNERFMNNCVNAVNIASGLFFTGFGIIYMGALLSDYKFMLLGATYFYVAFFGFHITVTRFKDKVPLQLQKIGQTERLLKKEELIKFLPAIIRTTRPRAAYPKLLYKTGIISPATHAQYEHFKALYQQLNGAEPSDELHNAWIAFQPDVPTFTGSQDNN